jgi:hypothetical protein
MSKEPNPNSFLSLKVAVLFIATLVILVVTYLDLTKNRQVNRVGDSEAQKETLPRTNDGEVANQIQRPERTSEREWADYLLWTRGYPKDVALSRAVADFNKRTQLDEVGKSQPLLRVDEVLAAIRGWSRQEEPIDDVAFDEFQEIAAKGIMPKGSYLDFGKGADGRNGYNTDAWSIYLFIKLDRHPRDQVDEKSFSRLIRMQYISTRKSKP